MSGKGIPVIHTHDSSCGEDCPLRQGEDIHEEWE